MKSVRFGHLKLNAIEIQDLRLALLQRIACATATERGPDERNAWRRRTLAKLNAVLIDIGYASEVFPNDPT